MDSKEEMIEEFDFIQRVIERQANNSFKIKGWTVTLVVVALIFRSADIQLIAAYIPLIGFWGLDSYYLTQEKRYRALFDWVRNHREDTNDRYFDLDASDFKEEVPGVVRTMFTPTLLIFYGAIGLLLAIYIVFIFQINMGGSGG